VVKSHFEYQNNQNLIFDFRFRFLLSEFMFVLLINIYIEMGKKQHQKDKL